MKLLVVEDELDLSDALVRGFEKKSYIVDAAYDGKEAYELYKLNEYDVIILDLNLPSMDGIEVLKAIREHDSIQRIIILSARTTIAERLEGLDDGANDYVCKPFDFLELEARVRCLLRQNVIQQKSNIRLRAIEVDTVGKLVKADNHEIDLAPKEYLILEYLMLHTNQVVSAETLLEHVWGEDINVFTDSVKVHVSNLRKKLKNATGEEYITTIRGFGYCINTKE